MEFDWSNKTILVVEDEPANYFFVEKVIKSTNVEILRATNGVEGVEMVKSHPDIDLILMDIYMPEMDGFEAAENINQIRPGLPIVAQTCYESQVEKEKLEQASFNDFIKKPININKLLVIMEKYLGKRQTIH